MKIALVGCGQIAEGHLSEISKISGCNVVGICDVYPSVLDVVSMKYNIPNTYTDFKKMLKELGPDVVHITTPPHTHFNLGLAAIKAGCHVYIEKPFTVTLKETETLIKMAKKHHVSLCVGTHYIFSTVFLDAFNLIKSRDVGQVTHIDAIYSYDLKGSYGKLFLSEPNHWVVKLPGQLFQNMISHPLSAIVPFLGEDFEVSAWANDFSKNGVVDDELRVSIYDIKNKLTVSLVFTSNIKPAVFQVKYYCTKKCLYVDRLSNTLIIDEPQKMPGQLGQFLKVRAFSKSLNMQFRTSMKNFFSGSETFFTDMNRLFQRFYESTRTGKNLPISYDEICKTSKIIDKVLEQLRSRT